MMIQLLRKQTHLESNWTTASKLSMWYKQLNIISQFDDFMLETLFLFSSLIT